MTAFALSSPAAADEKVRELQARIREMQSTRLSTKTLATSPLFAGLLPDGMMRAGGAYSVLGSTTLAMAMLSASSAAGSWCAVVGVPGFGAQAAAAYGIDLERLVLVPDPGDQWLPVTAALIDVLPLVVLRPGRITEADAGRLAARLRKREAALITLGDWPGCEATLRIVRSEWEGIGAGSGILRGRRVEVAVESRGMRSRSRWIRLPGPDAGARVGDLPVAGSAGLAAETPAEPRRSAGSDRAALERAPLTAVPSLAPPASASTLAPAPPAPAAMPAPLEELEVRAG